MFLLLSYHLIPVGATIMIHMFLQRCHLGFASFLFFLAVLLVLLFAVDCLLACVLPCWDLLEISFGEPGLLAILSWFNRPLETRLGQQQSDVHNKDPAVFEVAWHWTMKCKVTLRLFCQQVHAWKMSLLLWSQEKGSKKFFDDTLLHLTCNLVETCMTPHSSQSFVNTM